MLTRAAGPAWVNGSVFVDPQKGQSGRGGGGAVFRSSCVNPASKSPADDGDHLYGDSVPRVEAGRLERPSRRGGAVDRRQEADDRTTKPVLFGESAERDVVTSPGPHLDRAADLDRHQLSHGGQVVFGLAQPGAERGLPLERAVPRRVARGVLQELVERAVRLDQRERGLLADALHPWKLVRRIAAEDRELRVARGRDAVLGPVSYTHLTLPTILLV